jgi:hypothetical protein
LFCLIAILQVEFKVNTYSERKVEDAVELQPPLPLR